MVILLFFIIVGVIKAELGPEKSTGESGSSDLEFFFGKVASGVFEVKNFSNSKFNLFSHSPASTILRPVVFFCSSEISKISPSI